MPTGGVEAKPPWRAVPQEVRDAVDVALGSAVMRSQRVWGGYAPTPTFRLRLDNGRRAFFKAVGPDDNAFARAAFAREERVYDELPHIIAPWSPERYGAVHVGEWRGLLLEDLGPKSVPPWSPAQARGVARAYADFHAATVGRSLPPWVPRPERYLHAAAETWARMEQEGMFPHVAALAGERADKAARWLAAAGASLSASSQRLAHVGPPVSFLHGDTRSDNLRWTAGRLRLFDWPHVGTGPAEYDLAAFAQSVAVEGGPEPEQVVGWYAEQLPVRADVLAACVAAVAGYFAEGAWQPDIPGLPRVRPFQRAQMRVSLRWAARCLDLAPPDWLDDVHT